MTARRMAPSRPLERPEWRGFVPRRRRLVLCSAMGKSLAGTLMSGEEPGDELGSIVQRDNLRIKDGGGVDSWGLKTR